MGILATELRASLNLAASSSALQRVGNKTWFLATNCSSSCLLCPNLLFLTTMVFWQFLGHS